jgi:hypothetical protein
MDTDCGVSVKALGAVDKTLEVFIGEDSGVETLVNVNGAECREVMSDGFWPNPALAVGAHRSRTNPTA